MGSVSLLPGDVLAGSYRIVRELASGGMGTVYVAEQLTTGRLRAIKRMHAELAGDAQLVALFEREVRVGERIRSEHVVEVLDAGVDPATMSPWLAMELLGGESLRDEVDKGGPPAGERATDILMQICHGLAAAHRAGVIHRDLKPENVMVCPSEREGSALLVKLLDFGLSRFVGGAPSMMPPMGTALWMAPEQALGQPLGTTADVFALGLVAFYVLTGKVFWRSVDKGVMTVLHELVYAPPAKASERAVELGCSATLPNGFDGWFARATAKNPQERFPDAGAARDALRELLPATRAARVITTDRPRDAPQPPGAAYDPAWFVGRQAEVREALRYLRSPGKPAILWGERQLGKTWLLRHVVSEIGAADGYGSAVVQARMLLGQPSLDELLHAFGVAVLDELGLDSSAIDDQWRGFGTPMLKLSRAMERRVLSSLGAPLVVAIDSADAIWRSPVRDDFFALLRAWAERSEPPWSHLRLLLAVSTAPGSLIEDTHRSPFNLTVPIRIQTFTAADVARLAVLHGVSAGAGEIDRLVGFSCGHPMSARRVLYRMATTEGLDLAGAMAAEPTSPADVRQSP